MLNLLIRTMLSVASLTFFAIAMLAISKSDWPQACAWLLADISCTLTSFSMKEKA